MPCGCPERMAWLERKYPKVAEVVRPAHEALMSALDKWDRRKRAPRRTANAARRPVRTRKAV